MFLQPQELSLRLRPGVSQSFPLTITMPTDQPITELTMDTSPVPAGLNITFGGIVTGNPLVVQVRKIKMDMIRKSGNTTDHKKKPLSLGGCRGRPVSQCEWRLRPDAEQDWALVYPHHTQRLFNECEVRDNFGV